MLFNTRPSANWFQTGPFRSLSHKAQPGRNGPAHPMLHTTGKTAVLPVDILIQSMAFERKKGTASLPNLGNK